MKDSRNVAIQTDRPLTGWDNLCHGASSIAITQAGLSHEAIAANIRMAMAEYSRA